MGVALLTACNDAGKSSEKTGKDTTSVTMSDQKMDYPYTIAHPDYWQTGSQQNTMNVLKSLKSITTSRFSYFSTRPNFPLI